MDIAAASSRPVTPNRRNLVQELARDLRKVIAAGEVKLGEKLPSESALTTQYSVSRTVVREAIAALRADGLVEARQGAGVFVIKTTPSNGNPLQSVDFEKLSNIIEFLELRTAIESEAAGLAAIRRSPAQEEVIYEALHAIDVAAATGNSTAAADLTFHLAIAHAANNPRFEEFLSMLGKDAIPRRRLHDDAQSQDQAEYVAQLQIEHRLIADSIAARDEHAARRAMRQHLDNGQQRYRRMLRGT